MSYFSIHTHTEFSCLDAIASVPDLVAKAAGMKQPAIALTDHGNMSGVVQGYKAAMQHGMKFFPGVEAYIIRDHDFDASRTQRFHVGLLALDYTGYKGLLEFVSLSHVRPRFNRFPRLSLADLWALGAQYGEHLAITTGCYFGLVVQSLITEGSNNAVAMIRAIRSYFPHTFVEVQNHGIVHPDGTTDGQIVDTLIGIADNLDLPVIASQDSHYLDAGDKTAHALMKRMVYGGVEDEFPGDSFHLASESWVRRHYTRQQWARIVGSYDTLLGMNNLSIPALDSFTFHVPSIVKAPRTALFRRVHEALAAGNYESHYVERANRELAVIRHLGMSAYFMCIKRICEYMDDEGILYEARGSANSSLVCYLLGITSVDPLERGLDDVSFSRFLAKDRKKPPDIDLDIEDIRREQVLGYIFKTFDAVQIGTYAALGENSEGRGSVLQTYLTGLRRTLADDDAWRAAKAQIQTIDDVQQISAEDYEGLKRLASNSARRSYGVHAAGVLLSGDHQKIEDYVPTMLVASSDTRVSQFVMDDLEDMGYLKVDVLGQKTLAVMRETQELIGRDDPRDFTWIPDDDPAAIKALKTGRPDTGIFQFDGYAMAKGGKALPIRTTMDCVVASALFRPATMQTGLDKLYIERRNNPKLRRDIDLPGDIFEKHLRSTFGIPLFQEQVVAICRDIGMTTDETNLMLKIVKDSGSGAVGRNAERLAVLEQSFKEKAAQHGMDEDEAWSFMVGFAGYGFNRAHSTGYGIRSYRTAYLKAHYPVEYMATLLSHSINHQRLDAYEKEARIIGITIKRPDVNLSGVKYRIEGKSIWRPLSVIKGIGEATAVSIEENRPESGYSDVYDLIQANPARHISGGKAYIEQGVMSGKLEVLYKSGALDSIMER